MPSRKLFALSIPFIACVVQWLLWDAFINPYVWFLFFPAAFCSAWLGGLRVGVISTMMCVFMVWYIYIPPQFSFALKSASSFASILIFLVMGILFSMVFDRLSSVMRKTDEALQAAELAKAEVTKLYEKTLELDHVKSQFFANVSHELRTPLTLIMSPLQQRLQSVQSSQERAEVEMMLRNARLLYRHVSDLLDAAKLESGQMRVHFSRVHLSELVRVLAAHFDGVALERNIDYQVVVQDGIVAEVDNEKVERIFLNLLANAFKFTENGGRILVTLQLLDDEVKLSVQDNGPGVPSNMREAIFERFRQLEGEQGGTGLGLSIVKEFAELHGGRASVYEAEGGGALFSVQLPVHAPAGAVVSQSSQSGNSLFEQQTIDSLSVLKNEQHQDDTKISSRTLVLVVEDNLDMNRFISDNLRHHYQVIYAYDGQQGLRLALEKQPDLILTDVMMPNMTGDEMVTELRRHPEMAEVPIMMLTAKADDVLRIKMLESGVQDYLSKPFAVPELLARIGSLIADRQRSVGKLRESETRFEVTFEQAGVGIGLMSLDGAWLRVNHLLCHMLGYEMRDLLQQPLQVLMHHDKLFEQMCQPLLQRERNSADCECAIQNKNGKTLWINLTFALVWKNEQQADYFIVVIEDVSERKLAHDEIMRLNNTLEQSVTERTAELIAANKELESFAYAVSHDLRAPLRAMSGFAQALREDAASKLSGDELEYLQQIDMASHKMSELIDGLLTLSRSTRGELQRDEIDLSSLAEKCLVNLQSGEPQRQVSYQVEANMRAIGDAHMLEVVLNNLLSNAWKYTAKNDAAQIVVYSEMAEGQRRFCVRDNGAGFDMKHASHLFQPFQRLHRQEEFPGIGIGLATVQRIVHRHGGKITAYGEPNQGAIFYFTLSENILSEAMS